MAKKRRKIDPNQLNIFDYIRKLQQETTASSNGVDEGVLNITAPLRRAMCQDIKECPLSRWEIAGQMSHLIGREISKYMIDAWTAESKDGHRPPAAYLPAWCRVTGSRRTLQVIAKAAGTYVLPGPDALRAEIQKFAEQERKARAEKRKREMFLKEMESADSAD